MRINGPHQSHPQKLSANITTGADSNPYQGCSEVFVGGGWAGVYSFYRRVMNDPQNRATKACLMEESWRIGGRTYSVPLNNTDPTSFVVDVGAYRFSPDMHVVGDLIMKELGLATECYMESCTSSSDEFPNSDIINFTAPLRRIVDPKTGIPSGYATPLHRMIEICRSHGARVFTQTKLVTLNVDADEKGQGQNDSTVHIEFRDAVTGNVSPIPNPIELLVLNLPRNKFLEVDGVKESLDPSVRQTIECVVMDFPLSTLSKEDLEEFQDAPNLGKAYLYYKDAWWRTRLNLTQGRWPPNLGFRAATTPQGVRLNIRWHDGPVVCVNSSSTPTFCHGLLETYYSLSNETFYSSLSQSHDDDTDDPLGCLWDTDGPQARAKLETAHAAVVGSLQPLLQNYSDIDPNSFIPPSGLIVGTWHRPHRPENPFGYGYTAPTKVLFDTTMSGLPSQACGNVRGLTEESYRDTVLQPWGKIDGAPIFLVNNDYVCLGSDHYFGDWAEESLWQAERALYISGTPKPAWLDSSYYQEHIVNQVGNQHLLTIYKIESHRDFIVKCVMAPIVAVLILVVSMYMWSKYVKKGSERRKADYVAIP